MADYKITLNEKDIVKIISDDKGFKNSIENVLNQILEAQMIDHIGAGSY